MFNNFINYGDFVETWRFARSRGIRPIQRRLLSRFKLHEADVVRAAWDGKTLRPKFTSWMDIPAVRKRINRLTSGEPLVPFYQYVSDRYLKAKAPLTGLALGCGRGSREVLWYGSCDFQRLEAIDISAPLIESARADAKKMGYDRLFFEPKDVKDMPMAPGTYDVVFGEHSIHHFKNIDALFQSIANSLKPDGLFVVDEYVGPSRFQFSDQVLEIIGQTLLTLPPKFRRRHDGTLKSKVYRPGRLRMILSDPSESVESDSILAALQKNFEAVECKEYGGTILPVLFKDIAMNFMEEDEETEKLLTQCFQAEDESLRKGDISSDFIAGVFRKRGAAI